jgi:hypothetical protein
MLATKTRRKRFVLRALLESEYIRLAVHPTWLSEDVLLVSSVSARMSTIYLGVLVLDIRAVHETHDTIGINIHATLST